ncbi:MAG: hypothetical protein M3442_12640 [Chloroflexota bacterium]|nr:hypothetical protein [Chloroflexota bacterium]
MTAPTKSGFRTFRMAWPGKRARPSLGQEWQTKRDPYRAQLSLTLVVSALVLLLGLSRLVTGPWFHVYHPPETSLLEGRPVSWEAVYYTDHFPTFTADAPPRLGIAPVHYRTLLALYLAATLYTWTGSAYWSFAAVDLLFWALAGVAGYHLSRRLGVDPWGAALGALLLVASPLLVSHMWRHDLHPANFASMTLALWAGVTLVDEHRRAWRLAVSLGLLMIAASLGYQYQWVLAPLLLVLAVTHPRLGPWRGTAVVGAAVVLYLLATAALDALLVATVGPVTEWNNVASQPGGMIRERLQAVRTPGDLRALLPGIPLVEELIRSYHPPLLLVALAGVALLGWRVTLLTLTGLTIALFSLTYYPAPWAATTTYPLVYAGAGTACVAFGRGGARLLRTLFRGRVPTLVVAQLLALLLALALVIPPNADLVGDPTFLLTWWGYFAARYSF